VSLKQTGDFANCNFRIAVLVDLEIVNNLRNDARCWSVSTWFGMYKI